MGVSRSPLICKRELHPERLRPSGKAYMKFEHHEDALALVLNIGVKLSNRMPYVEFVDESVIEGSATLSFPPSVQDFARSRNTVVRLGSLYWNTSHTDVFMWCHQSKFCLPYLRYYQLFCGCVCK
jgi:hypothetical protein